MTTAIIGVGNIGGTVARALASGGEPVLLSATSSDKVQKLAAEIGTPATAALDNRDAVQRADAVILALWLDPMKAVIDEVADLLPGKLVIDPSNPIAIAADGTVSRTLPDGQSAGEVVAGWLPQGTRYAKGFGTLDPDCRLRAGGCRRRRPGICANRGRWRLARRRWIEWPPRGSGRGGVAAPLIQAADGLMKRNTGPIAHD